MKFLLRHLSIVLLITGCSQSASGSSPKPEVFEQVLEHRLQALKPSGKTERNVVFEEVKPAGDGRFTASFSIRDYGPGYPANHFYGDTCVAKMVRESYTLSSDGAGGWNISGRLTPSLEATRCIPNPSAGASSQPLSALSGTAAPSGPVAKSAEPSAGRGIPTGKYECWANGQARLMLNFTIDDESHYVGADGTRGTYSLQGDQVTFHGGALDGAMPTGFSAVYHRPGGRPTVSFRSGRGAEAAFCEKS